MRVTQGMISNNMLNNLSNSYSKLNTYMERVSTGKKINRPSDDPVVAMKGINFRREVSEVDQYKRNIGEVQKWMDSSDAALDNTTKALQKLRELAVQANNDTYDEDERKNIKEEVDQIKNQLVDIANTKVNDSYIFNGTNTDEKPFDKDGNRENDPNGSVEIEVSKGISLQANVDPEDVFTKDFFGKIDEFSTALSDEQKDLSQSIEAIDKNIDNTVNARAELGARMNRLELIENRVDNQEISAKKTMSDNEDINYEEAITDLITQQSLHRAALSASSRIIQPSLLDFLR